MKNRRAGRTSVPARRKTIAPAFWAWVLIQLLPGVAGADSSMTAQYQDVVGSAQAAITSEQQAIDQDNTTIASYQDSLTASQNDANELTQKITNYQNQIAQLQQILVANPLQAEAIQPQIDALQYNVKSAQAQLDQDNQNIQFDQQSISFVQNDIAVHTQDIAQQSTTSDSASQTMVQLASSTDSGSGIGFEPGGTDTAQPASQGSVELPTGSMPQGDPSSGGDGTFAGPGSIAQSAASSAGMSVVSQVTQQALPETAADAAGPVLSSAYSVANASPLSLAMNTTRAAADAAGASTVAGAIGGVPGGVASFLLVPTNDTNPLDFAGDDTNLGINYINAQAAAYPNDPVLQQLQSQVQSMGPITTGSPNYNAYMAAVQQAANESAANQAQDLQNQWTEAMAIPP